MRNIKLTQVDAFTNKLFGGNPSAVVFEAEVLSEDEMRDIAREMNLSETAFILPSKKGNIRLRYFTPNGDEIKFCGHASVGALYSIAKEHELGIKGPGVYRLQVETNIGLLPMQIDYLDEENIVIQFDSPKIDLVQCNYSHKLVAKKLGIEPGIIDQSKLIMREKTNDFIYLTIKSLKELESINYNVQSATEFAKAENIVVFCLITNQTFDKENQLHSRCFAPLVGVPEDPATGSAQGALVAYALVNNILLENTEYIFLEQGHFIKRPSQLKVKIVKQDVNYRATVYASAVEVFRTEIALPQRVSILT